MSKLTIIIIVGILLILYIIATPYITVHKIKVAAENHEAETLSEYIEFPSVRQSLKQQMNNIVSKKIESKKTKESPLAALGAMFAGTVVDKMVETYVTPASIAQIMAGKKPNAKQDETASNSTDKKPLEGASASYESINRFVVTLQSQSEKETQFILQRRGIGWKVTEIILPIDQLR
jgi:hypothetical protein